MRKIATALEEKRSDFARSRAGVASCAHLGCLAARLSTHDGSQFGARL
jgi:hypothetical protein